MNSSSGTTNLVDQSVGYCVELVERRCVILQSSYTKSVGSLCDDNESAKGEYE